LGWSPGSQYSALSYWLADGMSAEGSFLAQLEEARRLMIKAIVRIINVPGMSRDFLLCGVKM